MLLSSKPLVNLGITPLGVSLSVHTNFCPSSFISSHIFLKFKKNILWQQKEQQVSRASLFGKVTGREYKKSIDLSDRTDRQQTSNIQQWATRQTGNQQARSSYLFCVNEIYLNLRLVDLSFQVYLLQWPAVTGHWMAKPNKIIVTVSQHVCGFVFV